MGTRSNLHPGLPSGFTRRRGGASAREDRPAVSHLRSMPPGSRRKCELDVRRLGRVLATLLAAIAVGLMTAWAALAIYYSDLSAVRLRSGLAIAFAVGTVLAFAVLPRRRRTLVGFLVAFAVVVGWWLRIAP